METRFAHAKRPLAILAALCLAALGLFVGTGTAWADDPQSGDKPQSGDYAPVGIGQLFQAPDATQGQDPTLYEKYPDGAYSFDYEDLGALEVVQNGVDITFNGLSELTFAGTRSVTNGAIAMTWQATDLTAFNTLGDRVEKGVGGVADFFSGWLLPSMLILGAGTVIFRFRSHTGQVINDLAIMAGAGVAVFLLSTQAGPLLDAVVGVHDVGAQASTKIIESTSTDLATPFQGPTATYGDNEVDNSMRRMADAVWRTYVVTPWCYAEFGSLSACERWGQEVLSRNTSPLAEDSRLSYITTQIKGKIGDDKSDAYQTLTGHRGAYRLGIAVISLICALAFAGLTFVIALTSLVSMMVVFLLLIFAGLFACFAATPGRPRRWALGWLGAVVGVYLLSIAALLALAGALAIMSATIALTSSLGWGSTVIFTIGAIVAGSRALGILKNVFEANNAGNGGLGGFLAGAANVRRLLPRRPHLPKVPDKLKQHRDHLSLFKREPREQGDPYSLPRYSQYVRRQPVQPHQFSTDVARPRQAGMTRTSPYTNVWRYNDSQINQRRPAGALPRGSNKPPVTPTQPGPAPRTPEPPPEQEETKEPTTPLWSFPQSSSPRRGAGEPRLRDNPPPKNAQPPRGPIIDIDPKDVREKKDAPGE